MSGSCLDGTLPKSLSFLTRLTRLELLSGRCYHSERLEISFFDALGALNQLETLAVGAGAIIGEIPQSFSNMSLLREIRLSSTSNTSKDAMNGSFPEFWARHKLLERLEVRNIFWSGFSDDVVIELPSLKDIFLIDSPSFRINIRNLISGAPTLQNMILEKIHISGLTEADMWPENLQTITLSSSNPIYGKLSSSFWDVESLEAIEFNSMPTLSISIGSSIERMKNLTSLVFKKVNLVGTIVDEIGKCSNLASLSITTAPELVGTIPSSIGKLEKLHSLRIDDTSIAGEIPKSFENLFELQLLSLTSNYLKGTIPTNMANLTNLGYVYAPYNSLSGQIPNFQNLKTLVLNNNQFTGSIPPLPARTAASLVLQINRLGLGLNSIDVDMFKANTNLRQLIFFSNEFSQVPLPHPAPSLSLYDASLNEFTGTIPSSLCTTFDVILSNNLLSGNLSDLLRARPSCALQYLEVSNNLLEGEFSDDDYEMIGTLRTLKIDGNSFFGALPAIPASMTEFYASNNNFSGPIPKRFLNSFSRPRNAKQNFISSSNVSIGAIEMNSGDTHSTMQLNHAIQTIDLSHNLLECPTDSAEISALLNSPGLSFLSLANNRLTCKLPDFDKSSLLALDLSSNGLSGPLPRLGTQITSLVIHHNQFTGVLVPLAFLPRLTRLDISHNKFSGEVVDLALYSGNDYLVSLKANNNLLTGELRTPGMTSLQFADVSHNLFADVPNFRSIADSVRRRSLQFINIFLPTNECPLFRLKPWRRLAYRRPFLQFRPQKNSKASFASR